VKSNPDVTAIKKAGPFFKEPAFLIVVLLA